MRVIINFVQLVLPILSVVDCIFNIPNWTPYAFYESLLERGRHLLFLPEDIGGDANTNWTNILLAVLAVVDKLITNWHYTSILTVFGLSSVSILIMITNLMSAVCYENFADEGERWLEPPIKRHFPLKKLDEMYQELVETSISINATWSRLCVWFILYWCTWMSTRLDEKLTTNNDYARIVVDLSEMTT